MSKIGQSINQAVATVKDGGILVYPTEAVYGLGCDFKNEAAVSRLLKVKQREKSQGLVLIGSHLQHVLPLIKPENRFHLARALNTWPGHHTWVFPKSESVPDWISGQHNTVAVRISSHPTVKLLCDRLNQVLVSTSANISGQNTLSNCQQLESLWHDQIDYYLDLPLGSESSPSEIKVAATGQILR